MRETGKDSRMKPADSVEALAHDLQRCGELESSPLADLMSAVVQFYMERPASGLSNGRDSDMLLFQYGCYDWGDGEMFEVDLTRQFIGVDEEDDDAISQLHFTAYFAPDDELRALGSHDRWCTSQGDVVDFRNEILGSPALTLTAKRHRVKTAVHWENV